MRHLGKPQGGPRPTAFQHHKRVPSCLRFVPETYQERQMLRGRSAAPSVEGTLLPTVLRLRQVQAFSLIPKIL